MSRNYPMLVLAVVIMPCFVLLGGCEPDLATPGAHGPQIQVQVVFTQHHEGVTGTWHGTIIPSEDRCTEMPASVAAVSKREAGSDSPVQFDTVVPSQMVVFPNSPELCPGKWNIDIALQDASGADIVRARCERFDIRASFISGGVFIVGLRLIEGEYHCTSTEGSQPYQPRRDIEMQPFTVPQTIYQGETIPVMLTAVNRSEIVEQFTVRLEDTPSAGGPGTVFSPASATSVALNAQFQNTFSWNTAGVSVGAHTLRGSVDAVPGEADATNNAQSAVVNIVPPADVAVTGVAVAGPVIQGGLYQVSANMRNNGTQTETVTINLLDTPAGGATTTVGTSPPIAIPLGGGTATHQFAWNTAAVAPGSHTLTARIPQIRGEIITNNNEQSAVAVVERHDMQALSVSTPVSAVVGTTLSAVARIINNGNIAENAAQVTLRAQPPAGAPISIGQQSVSVNAGQTRDVSFSWDTACLPSGNYTLTAAVSVPNDIAPSNDTITSAPIGFAVDHELSIPFLKQPSTDPTGTGTGLIVRLTNNNSITESGIDVAFNDVPSSGPAGSVQRDPRLPVNLACGQSLDLIFTWFSPSAFTGAHQLTVSITNVISGDDPGNNSNTATITVQ